MGDIVMKYGSALDGFKIVFMRIDGVRLDPDDRYESPWLGGRGGEPESSLGGSGSPIIGIHGSIAEHRGTLVSRHLGLMQLEVDMPQ